MNFTPFFKNVYKNYVLKCQEKNLMDFDDLLLNTKTQTRPTNNPYKRSTLTHKTEKFDKMPIIFSTNNRSITIRATF